MMLVIKGVLDFHSHNANIRMEIYDKLIIGKTIKFKYIIISIRPVWNHY